jgi:glycosyltransferase involved in cell wall biosynthesis
MADVCFVCLHAYPLFRPSVGESFGGTEVRAWLFARGLGRLGTHRLSFLVFDHGQPASEQFDEVTVLAHPCYRIASGSVLPGGSARSPLFRRAIARARAQLGRAFGSTRVAGSAVPRERVRCYERIRADIYCVFGVSNLAAEVAVHCQRTGRKMLLIAGSDEDFSETYRHGSVEKNPYGSIAGLCRFAIESAHAIVTQTDAQARLARNRFGRNAVTIRNPVVLDGPPTASSPDDRVALWIGKSDDVKRPEVLVRLAVAAPSIRFLAVMNRSDPTIFDAVREAAPANLEIIERLPFADTERLFARAFALINTSRFEGFPNAFLQAGKFGVPVLSLEVDPDSMISTHGCGIVASGDVAALARSVVRLQKDRSLAEQLGRNLRAYVETHHRLEERARQLDELLTRLSTNG